MRQLKENKGLEKISMATKEYVVRETKVLISDDTVLEHVSLTKEITTVWEDCVNEKVEVLFATSQEYPLSNLERTNRDMLLDQAYIEKKYKLTREKAREYLLDKNVEDLYAEI
ncbi:hypothetical protein HPT25_26330 [Bacillus sp. BRMEA1]|nr:hypothetical protein [Neobacillus endophyticus]